MQYTVRTDLIFPSSLPSDFEIGIIEFSSTRYEDFVVLSAQVELKLCMRVIFVIKYYTEPIHYQMLSLNEARQFPMICRFVSAILVYISNT